MARLVGFSSYFIRFVFPPIYFCGWNENIFSVDKIKVIEWNGTKKRCLF
jgi:hypothetical protein